MRFAPFAMLLAACADPASPPADATLDARDAVLAPADTADAAEVGDAGATDASLGLLDGGTR
jgi:hypothetical protein